MSAGDRAPATDMVVYICVYIRTYMYVHMCGTFIWGPGHGQMGGLSGWHDIKCTICSLQSLQPPLVASTRI